MAADIAKRFCTQANPYAIHTNININKTVENGQPSIMHGGYRVNN